MKQSMQQRLGALMAMALLALAQPAAAQTPADPPAPPPASAPAASASEVSAPATPPAPPAAEAVPPAPAAPVRVPATVKVLMTTSLGPIVIAVETERAPVTAANFLRYVDQKRFDGTTFYRAMKLGKDGEYGLIQGGVRGDSKRTLPPIAHEPTSKTGLTHNDGAISMARLAPGSATGDFFIIIGALTGLDANPAGSGDNQGYAVFGRVVEGMELVRRIEHLPTSPTLGTGVMKGQMLADPVKIISVKRLR